MPLAQVLDELAALHIDLSLARSSRDRLILTVRFVEAEGRLAAAILARQSTTEPLPQLLARLVRGEINATTAGHAIARDPALAGQVAAATEDGAVISFGNDIQAGDVTVGDVAGQNIIKIYIGAPG